MAGVPFALGVADCSLFIGDWVARVTGRDPAAELRGTYASEAEWRALVDAAGGLPRLVGLCLERAGLAAVNPGAARAGDVGVVEIPALGSADEPFICGAVCTGPGPQGLPRWVTKLARGITRLRAVPLAAWKV